MFLELDPARFKKPETNRDRPRIYRENWKVVQTFTEPRSNPIPSRSVQSGSQICRPVFAQARNISDRWGCVLELDRKSSRLDKTHISNYLHPSGKKTHPSWSHGPKLENQKTIAPKYYQRAKNRNRSPSMYILLFVTILTSFDVIYQQYLNCFL